MLRRCLRETPHILQAYTFYPAYKTLKETPYFIPLITNACNTRIHIWFDCPLHSNGFSSSLSLRLTNMCTVFTHSLTDTQEGNSQHVKPHCKTVIQTDASNSSRLHPDRRPPQEGRPPVLSPRTRRAGLRPDSAQRCLQRSVSKTTCSAVRGHNHYGNGWTQCQTSRHTFNSEWQHTHCIISKHDSD